MNRSLWLLQSSPSPVAQQCFWFLWTLVPVPWNLGLCTWLHCLLTFVDLIPANWELPLQHTIPLHEGRSFTVAFSQSGTVCYLQRLQSHIQHPDCFLPHLHVYSVSLASPSRESHSIHEFSRWSGFSNSPISSVNLSQYLRWPTTFPGPLWLPSIPSHLSLTNGFVLTLDLAASSMVCKSNGMSPAIISMASVGVDLNATEIATKIFLCICFNLFPNVLSRLWTHTSNP